jgi:hypothetical protein
MIDGVVRAKLLHPFARLASRGGRNDRQIGKLTGDLYSDRANAAGAANDQDGRSRLPCLPLHVEPLEESSVLGFGPKIGSSTR